MIQAMPAHDEDFHRDLMERVQRSNPPANLGQDEIVPAKGQEKRRGMKSPRGMLTAEVSGASARAIFQTWPILGQESARVDGRSSARKCAKPQARPDRSCRIGYIQLLDPRRRHHVAELRQGYQVRVTQNYAARYGDADRQRDRRGGRMRDMRFGRPSAHHARIRNSNCQGQRN